MVTLSLILDYRVLLYLRTYRSDSWRSELRRYIQNRKGLGSNWGSQWPWNQILDSGPKLAVGSVTWWSALPAGSSSMGNCVCCLIIVVMFIGLRRAYRLGVRARFWSYHMADKIQRNGTIFMGAVDPSRHHVKILICQLEED